MPINKLSIQGIRGIRDKIEITTDGHSIMIHGPNGSGKSSIERALRWVLTGQGKPTDETPFTTESSFRRHVLVEADFPAVEVVFSDESSIQVTTDSETYSGNAQSAVTAIKKSPPFLRRTELLDVLSSRPVDRFQYFESFLALEDVDATIHSVDTNLRELDEKQATINQRIQNALDAMRPLLPEEKREAAISISTLEEEAMNTLVDIGLIKEKSSWENALSAIKAASGVKSEESLLLLRSQLTDLSDSIDTLSNKILVDFSFPEAIEEKRRILEPATADADKNELIQHAVIHFKAKEGDRCPVCNSIIDWDKTKETLINRLEALTEYLKLLDERDKASKNLLIILNEFLIISSRLVQLLGSENEKIKSVVSCLGNIEPITSEERDSPEQILALIAYGGAILLDHLRKVLPEISQIVKDTISTLPTADDLPTLRSISSLFERHDSTRLVLINAKGEQTNFLDQIRILSRLHDALRHNRQDFARETLERIGGIVTAFYRVIHPESEQDETTGAPSIEIQRHGRGTAFIRGQFANQGVSNPQWVYSDGHLDTVGICIFLALRRFQGNLSDDPKLLILDDIIVSIDLGHARRLIQLFRDEFSDHQLILLTHNGLFAHWCASLIPNLTRYEIKRWSLEEGPKIGEFSSSIESLRESVANGTAKDIAVRVMSVMDEWLTEARFAYQLSVPARPGEQYTLSDIWNPFKKALKKLSNSVDANFGGSIEAMDEFPDLPGIRNSLAAHENEFAREYPRDLMVNVAQACLTIIGGLYCSVCKSFVIPIPDRHNVSIMHCKCRATQYVRTSN